MPVLIHNWVLRVDKWIQNQKKLKHNKHHPPEHWARLEKREKELVRTTEIFTKFYEGVCSAERCLLYTTGFQFNVFTAFHMLMTVNTRLSNHSDPVVSHFFKSIDIQVQATGSWHPRLLDIHPPIMPTSCASLLCPNLSGWKY